MMHLRCIGLLCAMGMLSTQHVFASNTLTAANVFAIAQEGRAGEDPTVLDLSHKDISNIEPGTFTQVAAHGIRHINLSDNPIDSVPADIFANEHLQELNLDGTHIHILPIGQVSRHNLGEHFPAALTKITLIDTPLATEPDIERTVHENLPGVELVTREPERRFVRRPLLPVEEPEAEEEAAFLSPHHRRRLPEIDEELREEREREEREELEAAEWARRPHLPLVLSTEPANAADIATGKILISRTGALGGEPLYLDLNERSWVEGGITYFQAINEAWLQDKPYKITVQYTRTNYGVRNVIGWAYNMSISKSKASIHVEEDSADEETSFISRLHLERHRPPSVLGTYYLALEKPEGLVPASAEGFTKEQVAHARVVAAPAPPTVIHRRDEDDWSRRPRGWGRSAFGEDLES